MSDAVPPRSAPPATAVITVTHDSSRAVDGWIDALEGTGLREKLELCVVDSGSSPAERAFLSRRVAPRVNSLLMRPNLGYGRCSNLGAAATRGETLLFANPDTRVRSLPECIRDGQPLGGVVLGAVNRWDGLEVPTGFRNMPSAAWEARQLLLGRFSRAYRPVWSDPAWVSGAALAISRADFEQLHGFSPEIFLYFEDADLCARHRKRGGIVAIDRHFVVEHKPGLSTLNSTDLDGVSRWSGRIFAARHCGRMQAVALYTLLACYYVPRRVALTLLRNVSGSGASTPVIQMALDLLWPRRILRRLDAPYSPSTGARP